MKIMARLCGQRFTVHGCRHGMISKTTGETLKKPWGWFSTHPGIRVALGLTCNHGPKAHAHIQGANTAATAIYPPLLCRRFAKVLMDDDYQKLFPVFGLCEHEAVYHEHDVDDMDEVPEECPPSPSLAPPKEEHEHDEDTLGDVLLPDRYHGEHVEISDDEHDMEHGHESSSEHNEPNHDMLQIIRKCHRNLGHPGQDSFLRLLRDAGAKSEVIELAKTFNCPECLQRGRRAPTRPSGIPKKYDKWQCVSVDTFWWKTPNEVLGHKEKPMYVMGLSMMDEATDFHTAVIVRKSEGQPVGNMSAEEFKEAFSKFWLRTYPAPTMLRYDEEGFFKSDDLQQWLETFGLKLEPISGESAWQLGKHSRHLQTLKEQMNLLCMELQNKTSVQTLLSLAVSAKNNMHNIKGYSRNQWAFGQIFSRITSFLQQHANLPLHSARENLNFEEQLQNEVAAQKMFLQADAKRRISKALHSKCRPLREFVMGELVYYYRRGRGQGSRYGGQWYGPARILTHEKTGDFEDSQHVGSVVWISHAGKILRCSPEQLRRVGHELRHVDREINGPLNFHHMFEQIVRQQRYLDISEDDLSEMAATKMPEHLTPHFRAREKLPLSRLRRSDHAEPSLESETHDIQPDHGSQGHDGPEDQDEGRASGDHDQGRVGRDVTGRDGEPHTEGGIKAQGREVQSDIRGRLLQQLGRQPLRRRSQEESRHERLRAVPPPQASGRIGHDCPEGAKKRLPSIDAEDYAEQEGQHQRARDGGATASSHGQASASLRGGRSDDSMEQSGSDRRRDERSHSTHGQHGEHAGADPQSHADVSTASREARMRSRSPARGHDQPDHELRDSEGFLYYSTDSDASGKTLDSFSAYVHQLDVLQFELVLSPRDVHCKKGLWVVNAKAKKGAEVILRKLTQDEQNEFEEAMKKEIDSFISREAVRICNAHGVPTERIMQMRWIYTWKAVCDDQGNETGRKAKARLIVKGFQDPRLLSLPRESPTLSTMGRNLLLALTARYKMILRSGDIKTAFLQGSQSELQDELYGEPTPEVRRLLNMKDYQILRLAKAVYGLLNAPKQWFNSLCEFLISDGWIQHSLDKCLFKRVGSCGNVVGYLGVHVDDILCSGSGTDFEQAIDRLRNRFTFGSWDNAMEKSLTYCGCEIRQQADYSISVTQERFALSIDEITLTKERREEVMSEITHEERRSMRQTLGALNWRATQTAPWILSTVSHLQGTVETGTVADLNAVNKLVRLQRKRFEHGLQFPSIPGQVTLVTFTDAAWATRKDFSSQGGQLTLLMQENTLHGSKSPFCVISWGSRRLRRVARSSTSAEAQMAGNALDTHEFCKLSLFDMEHSFKLDLRKTDEYLQQVTSCMVCDARNIYDGVVKVETSGLQMEEKRTAIELLAIKERLSQAKVLLKWVDGEQELADGLTKPWRHEPLIKALEKGEWRIVYDPHFQSARRKKALGIKHPDVDIKWLQILFSMEA
jgi:hypothetical protein